MLTNPTREGAPSIGPVPSLAVLQKRLELMMSRNCEGGDTITAFAMLRLPVESRMREFLPCTLCATHRSVCRTCSLIWPVADRSRAL